MNSFDLSSALLTFYEVLREQAIAADEQRTIFQEMLANIPDERVTPHGKKTAAVLRAHIERELSRGEPQSRPETTQRPEGTPQAARKEPKQGHAKRK